MTHQQAIRTMASERYLLGEMSELERYQYEAHYFECDECAEDVRLGETIRAEVKTDAALTAPRTSAAAPTVVTRTSSGQAAATVAPRRFSTSTVIPWAAAAALALTAGYQSMVTVPGLRSAVAPQALAPVMLRGASRGVEPVVTIAAGQNGFVTLAPDVMPGADTKALAYELRGPNQAPVASGRAPLPPSGAPLMLLIPAERFAGAGSYTLIVRDADRADDVVGEFRFVAK